MPPIRTRGLTDFALELTDDLGGVWKAIDRSQVISVLIPTHVRSPRRVKRLLNGFVLTYRLAKRRAAAERLDAEVEPRASEIAKLTCLQIEFPLFAADLSIEPRLPEWVLRAHAGQPLPRYLPPEVRRRAEGYAEGKLNVDEILASEDQSSQHTYGSGDRDEAGKPEDAVPAQPTDPAERAAERGLEEGEQEKRGSERARVGRIHAEQLIRYLQKTRHVEGPRGDLIFMESRGAPFGLDTAVADALIDAATDGDLEEVRGTIGGLDDPTLQRAALRLLAQRGTEASIGIGGQNAISSLLVALSSLSNLDIGEIADELADSVAAQEESGYSLHAEELGGALTLATLSSREIGQRLLALVLDRPEAQDSELGIQVVAEAGRIADGFAPRVGQIASACLVAEADETIRALVGLDDSALLPLLTALLDLLPKDLQARESAEKADEAEE